VRLSEIPHGSGQHSSGERGGVANAQTRAASGDPHPLEDAIRLLQQFARFVEEALARGCEADRVGLPFQQALSDLLLQRLDLAAQGGLGQEDSLPPG